MEHQKYNTVYAGNRNMRIAFPLGRIGAGMICLEGTGALSHFSLRHSPDTLNEPMVFSAVCVKRKEGNLARVLEGPVPSWKVFGSRSYGPMGPGNGLPGKHFGLPRFASSTFQARFPFGTVELRDSKLPEIVEAVAANLAILKSPTVLRQNRRPPVGMGRLS